MGTSSCLGDTNGSRLKSSIATFNGSAGGVPAGTSPILANVLGDVVADNAPPALELG